MNRSRSPVDVKRIVAVVLLCSSLAMVFFVFYVLLSASDEDVGEETPTWWRGSSYAGVVVDIDRTRLILHVNGLAENLEFRLDGNTRFLVWGNTQVDPGVEVKVLFRTIRSEDTKILLARTVKVLRVESTPSASPSDEIEAQPSGAPSALPYGKSTTQPSGAPSARASSAPQPSASTRVTR